MSIQSKLQIKILNKLKIEKLNPMQEEALLAISSVSDVVLLSPTGTGKTLAFLLPIIDALETSNPEVQVLIVVPSRELSIQIEQVARKMGSGYKVNAIYGGRDFSKDKIDLKHRPAILIGTPGRIADHLRRKTFDNKSIKTLVLDEFDKSLEVGFKEEMKEIISFLPSLKKRILTSATQGVEIPNFVEVNEPIQIDYLGQKTSQLKIKKVLSPDKNKLETLVRLLSNIGNEPGIIFCNFKSTIEHVSDFLNDKNISHGCFSGGMEQKDRERALLKFRNGTHQIIIATDLAARGIDIPELKFIIHYQLPLKIEEFTHRNGRTARMNSKGTAYVLQWIEDKPSPFTPNITELELKRRPVPEPPIWATLFISGGRKDKVSKGDIAGLFFKQGGLEKSELGIIELKQDCAFVAVPRSKIGVLIQKLDNSRIKKRKVRVYSI